MADKLRLGGMLLCGGASRRMGQPKHEVIFAGETMLARVARILASAADPVVIVAGPDQSLPTFDTPVRIARDIEQHQGPLFGFLHGWKAMPDDIDAVFVTGCDSPFLSKRWIEFIASRLGTAEIAVPVVNNQPQPLSAVYRRSTVDASDQLLAESRHAIKGLLKIASVVRIDEVELRTFDPRLEALRSFNTPEELAAMMK